MPATKTTRHRWSQQVTEHSDAMTLRHGVFSQRDPKKIAASLKCSAQRSNRLKSSPFQSAMSMLNFYINRAGKHLSDAQRRKLESAKNELRHLFKRPTQATRKAIRKSRHH